MAQLVYVVRSISLHTNTAEFIIFSIFDLESNLDVRLGSAVG